MTFSAFINTMPKPIMTATAIRVILEPVVVVDLVVVVMMMMMMANQNAMYTLLHAVFVWP